MLTNNYTSNNNIVYLDYTNSNSETGFFETSEQPDSLASIMKNATLIISSETYTIL